jgi:hypothetical protein
MSTSAPSHDDLPLPDFDHLPLNSLAQRIRILDQSGVQALLSYERDHGNRLPVTEVLERRLEELEGGAEPSQGSAEGMTPEKADGPAAPRQIDQTTEAPSINPPSHGTPMNPAQPR